MLELLALGISALAFVLSGIAFYWTSLRGPKLDVLDPRALGFFIGTTPRLKLLPDIGIRLFIVNSGAKPLHVDHLFIKLTSPELANLRFNCRNEMSMKDFKKSPPLNIDHESTHKPFSLMPGAGVQKDLIFLIDENEDLTSYKLGEYDLQVFAVILKSGLSRIMGSKTTTKAIIQRLVELNYELNPKEFVSVNAFKEEGKLILEEPLPE